MRTEANLAGLGLPLVMRTEANLAGRGADFDNHPCRHARSQVEEEAKARDAEIEFSLNDPFLCEDTSVAVAGDGRIRRDHFKGFSKDQTMTFYQENEKMIEAKKMGQSSQQDLEWNAHQAHVRNILDSKSRLRQRGAGGVLGGGRARPFLLSHG